MAPRLKIGKYGHGDTAGREIAASDDGKGHSLKIRNGSGEGAARIQTKDADGVAERISRSRRGSGSGS
jgi:hypothetical protein